MKKILPSLLLILAGVLVAAPKAEAGTCVFDVNQRDSYFQQNVTGTFIDNSGGTVTTYYNNLYYATPEAAAELASCLGGQVVSVPSGYVLAYKPDTLEILLPDGSQTNAGYAIDRYFATLAYQSQTNYDYWLDSYVYYKYAVDSTTGTTPPVSQLPTSSTSGKQSEGVSSGTTYISKVITYLNNLLDTYRKLLFNLQSGQFNTSSNSGTGSLPTNTTASGSGTTVTTAAGQITLLTPAPWSFRYLRVDTAEPGWVSWREIEAFDANGNKTQPAIAAASCTWCGYGPVSYAPNPSVDMAASNVYDGNPETVWNAGETAENCSWYVIHMRNDGIQGYGCAPTTIRKAWIVLDYGSVRDFSRIRLQENGDAVNEINEISVSNDGVNFTPLAHITTSIKDREWIVIP